MTVALILAVLEGFEGTLDAVIERSERNDIRAEIVALRDVVVEKRQRIGNAALLLSVNGDAARPILKRIRP